MYQAEQLPTYWSWFCPLTQQKVEINTRIACTDKGIYMLWCKKDTGECSMVVPTYLGECGDGESSSVTHRYASHMGSATQACQVDTVKPIGRHFRLPGHEPHVNLVMLPVEKISEESMWNVLYSVFQSEETFSVGQRAWDKGQWSHSPPYSQNFHSGSEIVNTRLLVIQSDFWFSVVLFSLLTFSISELKMTQKIV